MEAWWNVLSLELQVFYTIAIAGTFFLLIQTFLLIIGFGGDTDIPDDIDGDVASSSDIQLVSAKTIVAFAVGFGWTGVIAIKNGIDTLPAVLLSLMVGTGLMILMLYMMKSLYGLRESGNINYKNAIGTIATVYVPIPPNQSGVGQVELTVQGRVRFVQAFTNAKEKIKSNTRVKIVDTIDQVTVLVEPLSHSPEEK